MTEMTTNLGPGKSDVKERRTETVKRLEPMLTYHVLE